MKKLSFFLLMLFPVVAISQAIFWTEDFGTGCDQGQAATAYTGVNGSWTVTETGFNGGMDNAWFISAAENGNAIGQCGSGCGNNKTLHIGNTYTDGITYPTQDMRAWYIVVGVDGAESLCDFIDCGATDKRIESPTINCTGYSSITIEFQYIEGGSALDNATLWYSDNNGGTWTQLADMPKTQFCNTDWGVWANYTTSLPASADNNPNVKIGFRWTNNDDATWADPSIAIDNITLSVEEEINCCDGDFNCDGVVNVQDMIIIVNQFGCTAGCTADLDGDGNISATDLTIFNGLYGDICP